MNDLLTNIFIGSSLGICFVIVAVCLWEKYKKRRFIKKYPRERLVKMIEQSGRIDEDDLAMANGVSFIFVRALFLEYGFYRYMFHWYLSPEQRREFRKRESG